LIGQHIAAMHGASNLGYLQPAQTAAIIESFMADETKLPTGFVQGKRNTGNRLKENLKKVIASIGRNEYA
jgi:hypothetical protein